MDNYKNISNSVIAARGAIAQCVDSFNRGGEPELASAVQRLTDAISNAPAKEMTPVDKENSLGLLEAFATHASKPSRSKIVLKTLGEKLWDTLVDKPAIIGAAKAAWDVLEKLWT